MVHRSRVYFPFQFEIFDRYNSLAIEASVGASYSSPVSVMATTTVEEKSALTSAVTWFIHALCI